MKWIWCWYGLCFWHVTSITSTAHQCVCTNIVRMVLLKIYMLCLDLSFRRCSIRRIRNRQPLVPDSTIYTQNREQESYCRNHISQEITHYLWKFEKQMYLVFLLGLWNWTSWCSGYKSSFLVSGLLIQPTRVESTFKKKMHLVQLFSENFWSSTKITNINRKYGFCKQRPNSIFLLCHTYILNWINYQIRKEVISKRLMVCRAQNEKIQAFKGPLNGKLSNGSNSLWRYFKTKLLIYWCNDYEIGYLTQSFTCSV